MIVRALIATAVVLSAQASSAAPATCTDGVADGHACHRIDLVARLDLAALGYGDLNDVWGWTDPVGGREYALVGAEAGAVFVDITDAANPRIVGRLPAHENIGPASAKSGGAPSGPVEMCKAAGDASSGPQPAHEGECGGNSSWRNIKVYADHAFVGSESAGHGLQVFDLTQLRAYPPGSAVKKFDETAYYGGFGHSHTLWIDAASGFLYAVGSDTYGGGPHFVDIHVPSNPVGVGGYAGDGYTHEIICQVYAGPDATYTGHQICIASNTDTLTVIDVTNKSNPQQLARVSYAGVGYTHQGSLTADQRYLFVDDELDELNGHSRTRTLVWDFADLDAPVLVDQIMQPRFTIDHNLYLHQGFMFQSDYTAGLVVFDARDPLHAFEVAYFDTYPVDDIPHFAGTWSNYPFFASGVVAVSDITRGLYLLRPQLGGLPSDAKVSVVVDGGPLVGKPGGVVTPAAAGGTFTLSIGGLGEFSAPITIESTGLAPVCAQLQQAVRCRLLDATPFRYSVSLAAIGEGTGTHNVEISAMVAGGGDELAPVDNRAVLPYAVTGTGSILVINSGGGGAVPPWLALLLGFVACLRRRRVLPIPSQN